MKKLLLIAMLAFVFTISANAQFHIELGLNGNLPQGDFGDVYDFGAGGYIEPKYALNENIDLGVLVAFNGFAGTDIDTGLGAAVEVDAATAFVVLPTATYRFLSSGITPYAGLGLGLYNFSTAVIDPITGGSLDESESKFGFAPRAGVYLGPINLGLSYNIVSDANFLQFNLGFRILGRG